MSRHTIDELAPFVAEFYQSPALIHWLEQVTGDKLQVCPPTDPHAYALYFYTRPGDHIGCHYDTSYYDGRRYTLLIGVMDDSSCRLEYELHHRNPEVSDQLGSVQNPPGAFVLFDGDKLRHRVTPLRRERDPRVADLRIRDQSGPAAVAALYRNMKDAMAYFGFRQVFRRLLSGGEVQSSDRAVYSCCRLAWCCLSRYSAGKALARLHHADVRRAGVWPWLPRSTWCRWS